ncbi:class I adenylate-forming enzyme family protein [Agrilactobacillus yilanensis]|uniref:Class I adenylate-forming enzyme family protein n=1 Tax=Agrilactobacillus yilanensis TaxID=2485997 RepID=A0ABW4J5Z7_9LACO|nr:AMP-binding protein [Agrilactobacillus yilanensis]
MSNEKQTNYSKFKFKTLAEAWARRCEMSPQHIFLIEEGQQITYEQMDRLSNKVIEFFKQQGIQAMDLIAMQLPTSIASIAVVIASFKAHVVMMPLSMHLDAKEFERIFKKMAPKMFILASSDLCTELKNGEVQYHSVDSKLFDGACLINTDKIGSKLSPNIAAMLTTSGTTGLPKGVLLSQENILYSESHFTDIYEIDQTDRLLLALPINHAIGFHHGIVSTFLTGSTCVLLERYDSEKSIELIQKYHCTYALAVPTTAYDLFRKAPYKGFLKKIICGGSPISDQLLEASIDKDVPIYNVFGTTESVPFVCTTPEYYRRKNGHTTAGFPIPGVEVRLIDSKNKDITESHRSGEIYVRGPIVFEGYFQNDIATQKVLDEAGWFHTGDLGYYNQDLALEVTGRINDIIVRGGENISSVTVESVVSEYYKIRQVAAIGFKDCRLGERIAVCVVLKPAYAHITLNEITHFLELKNVQKKFWPEKIIVYKTMPMTDSGKIIKKALIQQLNDYKD